MLFNSKNEFGSQKQDPQRQTRRHTKSKRHPFQSTLAWNFTAAALYILHHRAFEKREENNETENNEGAEDCSKKNREQPMFPYWSCVLELELSILRFTQSVWTANFNQFINWQSCSMLLLFCPWPHQLCQMYLHDVSIRRHPSVYQAFCNGGFVVQKICHPFSAIAHD